MSEKEKKDNQDENNNQDDVNKDDSSKKTDGDELQKRIDAAISEELKGIKEKLEKSYEQRDAALAQVAAFEKAQRDAELKRLEEEGKFKELYELKIAEEKASNEALRKQNIELTRDRDLKDVLRLYEFRNANAMDMAFSQIVSQLVCNDKGIWVHRTGASLNDFVKMFAEDESNDFLFKPKVSTGSGVTNSPGSENTSGKEQKSIFDMSQEEVLKRAAAGQFRKK